MLFTNDYEVNEYIQQFTDAETPNLLAGAETLGRLVQWTDANSDGWAYWQAPVNAAKRLIELLHSADRFDPQDCTESELRKALTPIKMFLTKQGVDQATITAPTPEPARPVTPITDAGIAELNQIINLCEHLRDGTLTPGDGRILHAAEIRAQVRRIAGQADALNVMYANGSLLRPRGEGWD